MKPLLPPQAYYDDLAFRDELSRILRPSWLFVGYTFDLDKATSWFTFELFGVSYFLQRDGDSIRCFLNSCTHRHSRLRVESTGDGPIICPYHGWMFRTDGAVNAIPRKPRFCDVTAADLEELKLGELQVATWGKLIFVQLAAGACSWESFIEPVRRRLEPIIQSIGPHLRRMQRKIKANWKAVIENSVEAYHLEMVHSDTFAKLRLGLTDMEFFAPHCLGSSQVDKEVFGKWQRVNRLLQSRKYKTDCYEHAIVFPNLGVGSLYGSTVAIEQFLPLNSEETLYTADIFGCALDGTDSPNPDLLNAFFKSSCDFAQAIFDEDMRITQIQHAGLRSSLNSGRLSEDERLVYFLQSQWLAYPAMTEVA